MGEQWHSLALLALRNGEIVLGDRLLVVPYEKLVSDPRRWTTRILAHCNLAEEAAPHAPHHNARAVGTASVMQVRRPISTRPLVAPSHTGATWGNSSIPGRPDLLR